MQGVAFLALWGYSPGAENSVPGGDGMVSWGRAQDLGGGREGGERRSSTPVTAVSLSKCAISEQDSNVCSRNSNVRYD
jgi:hypothetical protein